MRVFWEQECRCKGRGYTLRVCDPDFFTVPAQAIEVSEYFIARSVYVVPSFAEVLLPYFDSVPDAAVYTLPETHRFWLVFPTVADAIAFKLTHL